MFENIVFPLHQKLRSTIKRCTLVISSSVSLCGTSVPDPWHFGTDPDPDPDPRIHTSEERIPLRIWALDPTIFVRDFQDINQKNCFLLFTFWRYICSILHRQKVKKQSENSRNQSFFLSERFSCLWECLTAGWAGWVTEALNCPWGSSLSSSY